MPTVLRLGPYRFYFFVGDSREPPHIHIRRDKCEAKFWLDPVRKARNLGFPEHEMRSLEALVNQHEPELIEAWNAAFGN